MRRLTVSAQPAAVGADDAVAMGDATLRLLSDASLTDVAMTRS